MCNAHSFLPPMPFDKPATEIAIFHGFSSFAFCTNIVQWNFISPHEITERFTVLLSFTTGYVDKTCLFCTAMQYFLLDSNSLKSLKRHGLNFFVKLLTSSSRGNYYSGDQINSICYYLWLLVHL